jgi:hypothetical protein
VDRQVSRPDHHLHCPTCDDERLKHDRRFNFTKNGTLFLVFTKSSTVMWGAVMHYKCKNCATRVAGNDGSLLNTLLAHIRQAYPVEPRYATGAFHCATEISDDFDGTMKTYCNAEFLFCCPHQLQGRKYERSIENYYSLGPVDKSYPTFPEWIGMYPPSGKTIRELYDKAERSAFTSTGVSNSDWYKHKIQSVATSDVVMVDHTFAVVKNYNAQGANARFTMITSTKQIATAALVETTSVDQISHLCEQIVRKREHFETKVIYTDTWPHNDEFWKEIFAFCVIGRVVLFHCMKRIADMLNPHCLYYWEALWDLKACFYQHNADNLNALMIAMPLGTFKSDGILQ